MLITKEWLEEQDACYEGKKWVADNAPDIEGVDLVKKLMVEHLDWANWLIVRIMTRPQYLAYAIYSAEQVIEIYEKEYPDDNRPRHAIDAAKKVLANDTKKNRDAAWNAWNAAWAAGNAARAAWNAAWNAAWAAGNAAWDAGNAARAAGNAARAAGNAAWAAWNAAWDAGNAARAAGNAAWDAGNAAWNAAWGAGNAARAARNAAWDAMQKKILNYGLELLEKDDAIH